MLLDGSIDAAEPHLLASGSRDSARLLAQVFFDWAQASNAVASHAGSFALRGTLPYALSHFYVQSKPTIMTPGTF